jgi:hypothetical protein
MKLVSLVIILAAAATAPPAEPVKKLTGYTFRCSAPDVCEKTGEMTFVVGHDRSKKIFETFEAE